MSLLQDLKARRKQLGLKQSDMLLRIGISRQQYQRLEARGNPRLDTLELLAKGLGSQLMLVPQEKLAAVTAILHDNDASFSPYAARDEDEQTPADDPWQNLLGDIE